jgi:AmiR/NasT family two-component response regulator
MCRLRVTEDRAFAILSKHSQDHNVKVRSLAEKVIYTGSL